MRWISSSLRLALPAMLIALLPSVRAMNYAVPYVLHDLGYNIDTFGYGSTIGLLEVNNGDNNINIYSNSPEWGLQTFQAVEDFSGYPATTDDSAHGTLVAHIMDNMFSFNNQTNVPYAQSLYFTTYSVGMAPRAQYYGALFNGADTQSAFLSLNNSLAYLTATSGVQAINCSWGATVSSTDQLNGLSADSLLMDEYVGYYGKTNGTTGGYRNVLMVIAAGNNGQTPGGLLGQPADSYNGLSVGALDVASASDNLIDPNRVPIPSPAPFSSWGPLANGRCGVDVVAPGSSIAVIENFVVGTDANNNLIVQAISGAIGSGTSFAAPLVTGEAALLYGAPNHPWDTSESIISVSSSTLKGTPFSDDHKLIKAIIINSADKIPGLDANGNPQSTWQPGLITVGLDGVTNSIHPLNYAVGSGQANAQEAYYTYYELSNRFWDVNLLTNTGQQVYYTEGQGKFVNADPSQPALQFTATLVWDRQVDFTINTDTTDPTPGTLNNCLLSELDLILQQETSSNTWFDIYRSVSTNDNVQQIYMNNLASTNTYRLEVVATDLADLNTGEQYALAVSFLPIPEPTTVAMAGTMLLVAYARRRWLRQRGPAPRDGRTVAQLQRPRRSARETWESPSGEHTATQRAHDRLPRPSHDLYAAGHPRAQRPPVLSKPY